MFNHLTISNIVRYPIYLYSFASIIFLYSCKGPYTIVDVLKAKTIYNSAQQPFIVRNNQILVPAEIDGVADTVLFDTGFSGMIGKISDKSETIRRNFSSKTEAPDKELKVQYNKYSPSVRNNIWQFSNVIGVEIFTDRGYYSPLPPKIVGFLTVTQNRKQDYFLLNFSDSTIGYALKDSFSLKGYMELRCSFEEKGLYLYMTINSSEEKFYFDSGFGYSLILNKKPGVAKMKPDPFFFEGALFMSAFNPIVSEYQIYQNYPAQILPREGSIQLFTNMIYAPTFLQNSVGLDFMKRFDWVIDSKNKRVFVKPLPAQNYNPKSIDFESKKYGVAIIGENLQIIFRQKGNSTPLPLFKTIVSINGERVDDNNILKFVEYLNNIPSWDKISLTFDK